MSNIDFGEERSRNSESVHPPRKSMIAWLVANNVVKDAQSARMVLIFVVIIPCVIALIFLYLGNGAYVDTGPIIDAV
jgi:hypothetical protein